MSDRLYAFIGGGSGRWAVRSCAVVTGDPLPLVSALDILQGDAARAALDAAWVLRGVTSNERYVNAAEKRMLTAKQAPIGRAASTRAALIPIKKTDAWWSLTQSERREVFEETSRHTVIGLDYLPEVARRLHHCRDLATPEPFDFLTYFEFSPGEEQAFNELVSRLRETEEWRYVDREVDIRLERSEP